MRKSDKNHRQPNRRKWLKARRRSKMLARLTSAQREHRGIQKAESRFGANVRQSVREGRPVRISQLAWNAVQKYLLNNPQKPEKINYKPQAKAASRGG